MNVDWFDQKNANKTLLFYGAEESLVFYRTAPSSILSNYGDNGMVYQIKICKKMLTPNYSCVGATYKFTCNDTVFTSLVTFFFKFY